MKWVKSIEKSDPGKHVFVHEAFYWWCVVLKKIWFTVIQKFVSFQSIIIIVLFLKNVLLKKYSDVIVIFTIQCNANLIDVTENTLFLRFLNILKNMFLKMCHKNIHRKNIVSLNFRKKHTYFQTEFFAISSNIKQTAWKIFM